MINRSIQIAILALLIALPAFARPQKFKPAPPGAKGVTGQWIVSFDPNLSEKQFERALRRVLNHYELRLAPPAEYTGGVYESGHLILKISKSRARRITRDRAVIEVFQDREIIPTLFSARFDRWEKQ